MFISKEIIELHRIASEEGWRHAITHVLLERSKEECEATATATDGKSLLSVRFAEPDHEKFPEIEGVPAAPKPGFKVMIHHKAFRDLGKIIPKGRRMTHLPQLKNVLISEQGTNGKISAAATDLDTVQKVDLRDGLKDSTFPDWKTVVPRIHHDDPTVTVDPARMAAMFTAMAKINSGCRVKMTIPGPNKAILLEAADKGGKTFQTGVVMPIYERTNK